MEEWWQITLVFLGAIITILTVWEKIESRTKKTKEPEEDLKQRVSNLEKQSEFEYKAIFAEYEMRFKRDLERITEIEKSNRLTQKAILALLSHAIDGNNIEQMKDVEKELNVYIFNR